MKQNRGHGNRIKRSLPARADMSKKNGGWSAAVGCLFLLVLLVSLFVGISSAGECKWEETGHTRAVNERNCEWEGFWELVSKTCGVIKDEKEGCLYIFIRKEIKCCRYDIEKKYAERCYCNVTGWTLTGKTKWDMYDEDRPLCNPDSVRTVWPPESYEYFEEYQAPPPVVCSFDDSGHIEQSASTLHTVTTEPDTSVALFFLSWEGSDLDLILHSPNGTTIDPSSVYYVENATYEYYMIPNPEPGTWTTEVRAVEVAVSGEDYSVSVYVPVTGDAVFNNIYSDYGVDDDGNGLYDHIDIEVGINVTSPGWYWVNGSLYDANGSEAILVSDETYLKPGDQLVTLKFYGMHLPGAYHLRNLTLYKALFHDGERFFLDLREEAYTTEEYYDFDPIPQLARLTRHYADHGTDVDGDGLYEFLTVDVGVDVTLPGQYTLTGYLYDLNGSEVVWSIDSGIFEVGYHVMHLDFDGKTIEKHRMNGSYCVGNLFLTGRNWTVKDAVSDAHATSAYNYTDFVDPVSTENEVTISGVGLGEIRLIVSFTDTIPVFAGRYSYDLVGINVPQRPNNFTITTSEVKNLKVGVKKIQDNTTRIWVTQTIAAPEGIATVQSDLPSPGNYHVKIFGDAAEGVSEVDLELTAVKKIKASGDFSLSIDISGFPAGKYTVTATADTGCFTDLTLEGLPLTP